MSASVVSNEVSAARVFGVLSRTTAATWWETVVVVVQVDGPPAIGAAVASFPWLLADVVHRIPPSYLRFLPASLRFLRQRPVFVRLRGCLPPPPSGTWGTRPALRSGMSHLLSAHPLRRLRTSQLHNLERLSQPCNFINVVLRKGGSGGPTERSSLAERRAT